jgi:hypothetical protein
MRRRYVVVDIAEKVMEARLRWYEPVWTQDTEGDGSEMKESWSEALWNEDIKIYGVVDIAEKVREQ